MADIDECSLGTAECNQGCHNEEGSFNCTCYDGYELHLENLALCVGMHLLLIVKTLCFIQVLLKEVHTHTHTRTNAHTHDRTHTYYVDVQLVVYTFTLVS